MRGEGMKYLKSILHNYLTRFLTILLLGMLIQGCAPKTIINASYDGDLALTEELIREGDDVNSKYSGITPLHNAAANGHLEVVKLLIENGADINSLSDNGGITPLSNAALNGHFNVVKLLVENGANVNLTSEGKSGIVPLHNSANYGSIDIVEFLIKHGAEVNATTNPDGVTPLHNAAANGHIDIVKILIENGAEIDIVAKSKNKKMTPLDNAIINGHDDIVKLLTDKGGKRNLIYTEEQLRASEFCASVGKLEKGMSANEIKNILGDRVLQFHGPASCRLAKQGGLTYKDRLSNGLIYTIEFDADCKLEKWNFKCKE